MLGPSSRPDATGRLTPVADGDQASRRFQAEKPINIAPPKRSAMARPSMLPVSAPV